MPTDGYSFTRGVFAGEIHNDLLFPYPPTLDLVNPEEASVVARLVALIEDRLDGLVDSVRFDEEETIPDEAITALGEHGFLGMTIPKRYGGLELSARGYARVCEAIGGVDSSIGVFIGVHCGLGSKAIALYGTDEQKQRWLPRLARGEILVSYALTEPLVGSDAQHVRTTAVLSADGSHWSLNGEKVWIGNAHRAAVLVTFAQTAVEREGVTVMRPTAFLIEPTMAGFKVLETARKMGIRGSTQAQLAYTNLQVPATNVLGQVGKGFAIAVTVLNGGRLTLAAGCTGASKHILGDMAHYAEQRIQFGRPLADFEITQRKLSSIASEIYAADAMLGALANLAATDDSDWSLEAAIAKVFTSELVWRAADEMVQVAGGRGFVKPYPYERFLRDARINRIFEGANEILRLFIALNGVQTLSGQLREVSAALREPLKHLGLLSELAATRVRGAFGTTATLDVAVDTRLARHKEYFEKHVGELRAAAEQALARHRGEIVDRQLVVERLANMAIEVFATACVISRTQSLLAAGPATSAADALRCCDLFCVESGLRFRAARMALDGGSAGAADEERRELAASVRRDQGYSIPDPILMCADVERGASGQQ
ncbi:MAG: acyl-CoA dehydrogenase family protein [Gemmatimonadota bacterium]|nr:acyl-CoA dehydrogenase family protein [Gemmatimonadota bacterium]